MSDVKETAKDVKKVKALPESPEEKNPGEAKVKEVGKSKVEKKADPEPPRVLEVIEPAKIENDQLMLTPKHLELIKSQIAKDSTPEEFDLFIMMARRTRLDPIMRQLHFIKYGGKVSYVTSIDGYRIIAHRTGMFAGVDEPRYDFDKEGRPVHCSITVYKMVMNTRCGFSATVKFGEYDTGMNNWKKMPETMIAKVAEAHALRKAFPNDLSGIYTQDEMEQAEARNDKAARPAPKAIADPSAQRIDTRQVAALMGLLKKKGKTSDPILTACKIAGLSQLTVKQYNNIVGQLIALKDVTTVTPEEAAGIFGKEDEQPENEPTTTSDAETDEIAAGIDAQKEEDKV